MNILNSIVQIFNKDKPHKSPATIRAMDTSLEDFPQAESTLDSTTDELLLHSYLDSDNERTVARIANLQQLKKLNIEVRSSTRNIFEKLSNFSGLEVLCLSGLVSDQDLGKVTCLQNLHTLSLQHTGVTDSGLSLLKQLDSLRTLSIRATTFSPESIRELSQLKQLETLSLCIAHQFNSLDLQCLAELKVLKHLELNLAGADRSQLRFLSKLDQLESLSLNRYSGPLTVYEDVLANLGQTQLNKLSLQHVKLTVQAWTNVCNISSLTSLDIRYVEICQAENKAGRQLQLSDLQQLERLTNLKDLKAIDRRDRGQKSLFPLIHSLGQLDELESINIRIW